MLIGVMMRVRLAGFRRIVMGVCAVARRHMGMMGARFGIVAFVVLCSLTVMAGSLFVVFGGGVMMLGGRVLARHRGVLAHRPSP